MVEGYGSADNRRVVTGLMNVVVRCCEEGTHTPHGGTNSLYKPLRDPTCADVHGADSIRCDDGGCVAGGSRGAGAGAPHGAYHIK